jgi:predicted RNA-binding protein YlxR (DUF448 family)
MRPRRPMGRPPRKGMSRRRSSGEGPRRTCVQCGAVAGKERFLRIAGRPGSAWVPDPGGGLPGRGIYLCREGGCIERFGARIRTRKGGARWKMGDGGNELADRLAAIRSDEA